MTATQLLPARSPWFTTPADRRRQAADRAETLAAYAALHTGALGIHAPHPYWTGDPDGTAHFTGPDGLRLTFDAARAGAGQPAVTAFVPASCGTVHTAPLTGPLSLALVRTLAAKCAGHQDEPTVVLTLVDAHRPTGPAGVPTSSFPAPSVASVAAAGPADPLAEACWCAKGGDPYQCPAAEDDRCEYQSTLPELNPFGGFGRERDAKVVRTCPEASCSWRTSSWHVDDGSAEAELHGHTVRVHGTEGARAGGR